MDVKVKELDALRRNETVDGAMRGRAFLRREGGIP